MAAKAIHVSFLYQMLNYCKVKSWVVKVCSFIFIEMTLYSLDLHVVLWIQSGDMAFSAVKHSEVKAITTTC